MDPKLIWNIIRPRFKDWFTFARMKDLVGLSGMDVLPLSNLVQKPSGGASKSQLLAGIDQQIHLMHPEQKNQFMSLFTEKFLERISDPNKKDLSDDLRRHGFVIEEDSIVPIELTTENKNIQFEARIDIEKALKRFSAGDLEGALTSACGSVDSVTSEILTSNEMQKSFAKMSFQERCKKSYELLGVFDSLEAELKAIGWSEDEVKILVNNYKKIFNLSSAVLQKLRSRMSDVHGTRPVLESLVKESIRLAQMLLRPMQTKIKEDFPF